MIPQADIDKYNEKRKKSKTLFYQLFVTGAFFTSSALYIYMITQLYGNIFSFIPIFLGLYISDLYFGIVHVYLDNRKIYKITNFHEELVYSFQYSHHITPKAFINNVIIFSCSGELTIIVTAWINTFLLYFLSHNNNYKLITTTMCLGSIFGQINHGFAHMNYNELSILIKFLQKCKIILTTEEHNKHHIEGQLNYGLVNGWSNPLMNYLFIHYIQPFMARHPSYFIPQKLILKSSFEKS
jgi:hypothetical protein